MWNEMATNERYKRRKSKSRQTSTIDKLTIALSRRFGSNEKFTTRDIRLKTSVDLTLGEIRGAMTRMHNEGLLLRRGVSPITGYGLWMLSTRGLIRANRAAWREECRI